MKKTNENGITLIALVVTIVVLLILAGITITYVMADGGIFDSAKTAATATIKSQISDYASQVQATYMTQFTVKSATGVEPSADVKANLVATGALTNTTTIQKFFPDDYKVSQAALKDELPAEDGKAPDGNVEGTIKVTYQNKDYTITFTNGVPTVSDGVDHVDP